MVSENLKNFKEALDRHVLASGNLSRAYVALDNDENDLVSEKYPYHESFDELYHELLGWKERVDAKIRSRQLEEDLVDRATKVAWARYSGRLLGRVPGEASRLEDMGKDFRGAFVAAVREAVRVVREDS